jgi:hypothetical protein
MAVPLTVGHHAVFAWLVFACAAESPCFAAMSAALFFIAKVIADVKVMESGVWHNAVAAASPDRSAASGLLFLHNLVMIFPIYIYNFANILSIPRQLPTAAATVRATPFSATS